MSITSPSIGSSIGGLCVQWLILLLVPKQRYNPKLPSQPTGPPQINPFEHSYLKGCRTASLGASCRESFWGRAPLLDRQGLKAQIECATMHT